MTLAANSSGYFAAKSTPGRRAKDSTSEPLGRAKSPFGHRCPICRNGGSTESAAEMSMPHTGRSIAVMSPFGVGHALMSSTASRLPSETKVYGEPVASRANAPGGKASSSRQTRPAPPRVSA